MLEQEDDRTVGAEITAVLAQSVAHVGNGALTIVGQAIDDDGGTVDAVAFVADFLVADAFQFAGTALDGARDVVGRHVFFLGLGHRGAQTWIKCRIAAAEAGGNRNFLDQLGEDLAAFGVLPSLAMLDVGPFGMPCHV